MFTIEEIRAVWRQLARAPGFCALAVLPLALAGGAVVCLASLLDAVVWRPIPVPDPARLALMTVADDDGVPGFMSQASIGALERLTDVFEMACGTTGIASSRITLDAAIVIVARESVTGNCSRVLGVVPRLGRVIAERESTSAEPVVVISERLWRERFHGDQAIVGRTLVVDGAPLTIIGVADSRRTANADQQPDITLPLSLMGQLLHSPSAIRASYVIGRLASGVTMDSAQARLRVEWPRIVKASEADAIARRYMRGATRLAVEDGAHGISPLRKRYATSLSLLMRIATVLMAVACLNVGGLFLVRAQVKRRELMTHVSLGATRWRIAMRIVVECLALAMLATLAAIVLAWWFSRALTNILWIGILPLTLRVTPGANVVMWSVAGGLLAAVGTALPSLMWWSRTSRHDRLGSGGQDRHVLQGIGRSGRGIIAAQVALGFALLCCSAMFMQELIKLRRIDPGYETSGLYFTRPAPVPGAVPQIDSVGYMKEMLTRLGSLDGVEAAALSNLFPVLQAGGLRQTPISMLDAPAALAPGGAFVDVVSPTFFRAVGVGMVAGRSFTDQDTADHPGVAIVNLALARQLFGTDRPIGRHVRIGEDDKATAVEVVGVVENISPGDVRIVDAPMVYRPIFQETAYLRIPIITLRARDRGNLARAVRETVASFGRHFVYLFKSVNAEIDDTMVTERVLFTLSSFAGGLSTLVSAIGVYSLFAFGASRRRREMGLRKALGASGGALTALAFREGMTLIAAGLLIGGPAALGLVTFAARLMPGVPMPAAGSVALAALMLSAAGALAIAGPAARMGRTDASSALRDD